MTDTAIVVINAYAVIGALEEQCIREHTIWGNKCAGVRAGFRQKTSRSVKNGKEYESTGWYKVKPDGGLESVGKKEPDYSKYYPPEPKPAYSFKFQRYQDHIILEEKDYLANQKLFKDCLAFRLEECRNFSHPLYKNPNKALADSVRKDVGISGRSPGKAGQKRDPAQLGDDDCLGDGDCDTCEHNDECPVIAERDEE